MWLRALLVWVLLVGLAILNGTGREALLSPRLGATAGHLVSSVLPRRPDRESRGIPLGTDGLRMLGREDVDNLTNVVSGRGPPTSRDRCAGEASEGLGR